MKSAERRTGALRRRAEASWWQRPGPLLLGCAAVLAIAALFRPFAGGAGPRASLALAIALGLGILASAFYASLRGHGDAEAFALHMYLALGIDAIGQILSPLGWPLWPLSVLLVAAEAAAEPMTTVMAVVSLLSVFAAADAAVTDFRDWREALAMALGLSAVALVVHRAQLVVKQRLERALGEVLRLKHGIDQLDAAEPSSAGPLAASLRQVSGEGRRERAVDGAVELQGSLFRIVRLAKDATKAGAVLYFDVDHERKTAYLRAADAPPALKKDAIVPLSSDPFAFVVDRRESFYITDFKRLLWELPYYERETRVGTLLAVPVLVNGIMAGVLIAEKAETQAFTGDEPQLLGSFAEMAAEAIISIRAALGREELGAEFKAIYAVSRHLATATDAAVVKRLLLRSAGEITKPDGAAVVLVDAAETRYTIDSAEGWMKEFQTREVGLTEKTWAAWVLRSADEPYFIEQVSSRTERLPLLVLDEGSSRAESLLAVPLKARSRTLGALMLTGPSRTFDAATNRVLGFLSNQAAGALSTIQVIDVNKELAVRDGLTGLYNRRAFADLLANTIAREDRHEGRFALVLVDIDHFKKINDTYGHPAGDAALRHTAALLERHLRKGDQAARYGGEEFALVLPGTDAKGAMRLAERVRGAVQASRCDHGDARLTLTVSAGLALWPDDGRDSDVLLAAADKALYVAKERGRNRVCAAGVG